VAPERLLVVELGEYGYPELAAFLGVRAPDEPYPRSNSGANFGTFVLITKIMAMFIVAVPFTLSLYVCHKCTVSGGKQPQQAHTKVD
jgi:hypothetical protein